MNESFIYSGKVDWEQALFSNDAQGAKYMKTHTQYNHKLQLQSDCRTFNNRHLKLSKEIRWFSSRARCKSFHLKLNVFFLLSEFVLHLAVWSITVVSVMRNYAVPIWKHAPLDVLVTQISVLIVDRKLILSCIQTVLSYLNTELLSGRKWTPSVTECPPVWCALTPTLCMSKRSCLLA